MKKFNYTLGLDLGANSIGWSAVFQEDNKVDLGVRVFPAGLNRFNTPKEASLNEERRTKRAARRANKRKAKRKAYLKKCFQELKWMPKDEAGINNWNALNVYELRSRAIREKISLSELGRVLLHLNQRRGFLSLRKNQEASDKDNKGMLGEISDLQDAIESSGKQTVGNYLYDLYQSKKENVRIRKRHIRREMLYHEFDLIWQKQQTFYPTILTDSLRWGTTGKKEKPCKVVKPLAHERDKSLLEQFGFEHLIFFQRAVYWKERSIGLCQYEGPLTLEKIKQEKISEEDAKKLLEQAQRAPIADRRFQEFRMLQEVYNLRIYDSSQPDKPTERELTSNEREVVLKSLRGKGKEKLESLKKKIAEIPDSPDASQITFTLETGGTTAINGMRTDMDLRDKKNYGSDWKKLSEDQKNKIVEVLTKPCATDDDIFDTLVDECELSPEIAEKVQRLILPSGYANLSIQALEKLLPHLRAGMKYMGEDSTNSAIHAAGYQRRDEENNKVFEVLPLLNSDALPHIPKINNPVVKRALSELRKVVNGLIRKYGKPEGIHVEMARNLKMNPKKRKEYQKLTKAWEKERKDAAVELLKWNVEPNSNAILLYRLWKEQRETCIYSGRSISKEKLINGEINIDHILPGRSLDDSRMNKVVCFRNENDDKGDRTPHQWLAKNDPARYEEILQRAKKLPLPKRRRLSMEDVPEDWLARDLNDTAWIAKVALQYLGCLMKKPSSVLGMKGAHTAKLREQWQLHGLLRNDGLDLKNRDDHRHHALDAAVIACCDHAILQKLANNNSRRTYWTVNKDGTHRFHDRFYSKFISPPWESFREDIAESLNKTIVSHKPSRKVSGKLHQETNYGPTKTKGEIVYRKAVDSLSKSEIGHIRDPKIRSIIQKHYDNNHSLKDEIFMPDGRPIKKVRLIKKAKDAVPRKPNCPHELVRPQNIHHVTICINKDDVEVYPVSVAEAIEHSKSKKPLFQKASNTPECKTMHLSTGDTIKATIDDIDKFFVFKTMATTTMQMFFAAVNDATKGHKHPKTGKSLLRTCKPGTFIKKFPNAHKVDVLPTGEVRSAK